MYCMEKGEGCKRRWEGRGLLEADLAETFFEEGACCDRGEFRGLFIGDEAFFDGEVAGRVGVDKEGHGVARLEVCVGGVDHAVCGRGDHVVGDTGEHITGVDDDVTFECVDREPVAFVCEDFET